MSSSARIDELRRKFDENPRRFFAPLANEHRKAGELEQAIALCRAHLPHQAGHISGHIVLAQALSDAGEHEEARYVFHQALELDPENLIALRYLGDLARERGDLADAGHWYQRVLEVDPRNEEMSQLARQVESERLAARASRTPTPHMSTAAIERADALADVAPPVVPAAPPRSATPASIAELDDRFGAPIDTTFESSFGQPLDAPDASATPFDAMTEDVSVDDAALPSSASWWSTPAEPATPGADRSGRSDPANDEWQRIVGDAGLQPLEVSPDIDLAGLATSGAAPLDPRGASADDLLARIGDPGAGDLSWSDERAAGAEHEAEPSLAAPDPDRRSLDLGDLEAAADPFLDEWLPPYGCDAAATPEPFTPAADDPESVFAQGAEFENLAESPLEPVLAFEELSLEVATHAEMHDESVPGDQALSDDVDPFMGRALPDAPPTADATPAAFVTETMAELYLQQGFDDEALEVYRQLLAQRPDDATLRERIAMVEASRAVPEPVARIDVADDADGLPTDASPASALDVVPLDAAEQRVERDDIDTVRSFASIESIDVLETVPPVESHEVGAPVESIELSESVASLEGESVAWTAPEAPAGPTAREFFAALAARRPVDASDGTRPNDENGVDPMQGERAVAAGATATATSEGADPLDDEDIDAFNAWLEGLRKP